jgi:hypothetical protein
VSRALDKADSQVRWKWGESLSSQQQFDNPLAKPCAKIDTISCLLKTMRQRSGLTEQAKGRAMKTD